MGWSIAKGIDELWECCEAIFGYSECDTCPLKHICLMDTTVVQFADLVTQEDIKAFLKKTDSLIGK